MIRKCVRFFSTILGWLAVAVVIGLVSLLIIDAQERHRTDLDLRVWEGAGVM